MNKKKVYIYIYILCVYYVALEISIHNKPFRDAFAHNKQAL